MILDARAEFCDATAANGTDQSAVVKGNVIDTHIGTDNALQNLGAHPLYLVIQVTTAYSAAGTSVRFQLLSDDAATLDGSVTTHVDTGALATGSGIAAGTQYVYTLPHDDNYQQFIGIAMTTVGAVAAGAINAFLTSSPQVWTAYADKLAKIP